MRKVAEIDQRLCLFREHQLMRNGVVSAPIFKRKAPPPPILNQKRLIMMRRTITRRGDRLKFLRLGLRKLRA